jgi:FkbM family methyltransferase
MDAQVRLPASGMEIRTTDTRHGPMQYYSGDQFIGRSLELYGEYSPGEVELFRKLIKPGWVVVNGGANIGALTVPIADLVGADGVVHAFEPHPEHFKLLKSNSKGRKNIKLHELALWHSRGDNKMRKLMEIESGNYGCTVLQNDGPHTVRMMALDDVLGDERVDLLMLDIEGTEIMALEGARKILKRDRPLLYLEDQCKLDDNGQKCGDSTLVQYVRSLDYVLFDHRPAMYSPDNFKNCPENAFTSVDPFEYKAYGTLSYNLLCVPSERLSEFRAVLDDPPLYYKGETGSKLQIAVPRFPLNGTGWACIARMGGVGDNLMAASACRPLKELGYQVEVISQAPMAVVFQHNPYIDKLSVYEAGDWPTDLTQWQKWFQMRAKEYDRFANLSHSCEALCAAFTIQTAFWWPEKFRRKLFDRNYLESIHDILDLPHTFGPLFFPTAAEREQARITRQALKADLVIGWCLSGTRIDKIYPQSGQVVARLIKELGAHVVLMGAPPPHRDFQLAKEIMQIVEVTNGSTAGLSHAASPSLQEEKWPIRRILTFAATCDLYIGMDTGPSWGVAFEPIPKIILLSHASPTNITRHWVNTISLHADQKEVSCAPCHRLHDDMSTCRPNKWNNGAACISDIGAELVIEAAKAALSQDNRLLARLRSDWASRVTLLGNLASTATSQSATPEQVAAQNA